jgi:D-aminopeptidase
VRLRYGHHPDLLELQPDGSASGPGVRLRPVNDGLWMDRPNENHSALLLARDSVPALDVAGRFHCDELGAELTVVDAGGALHGAFSGFLGQGRMELMDPVGGDVWTLPCPRALDHTPPGDWTLAFQRNAAGEVCGVTVGCWLARRLQYRRTH